MENWDRKKAEIPPRPTTPPVSPKRVPSRTEDSYLQSERVREMLSECLVNRMVMIAGTREPELAAEIIEDMQSLGMQSNLSGYLTERNAKALLTSSLNEKYLISRWDFYNNTAAYMKLRLGSDAWYQLIDELYGVLRLYTEDQETLSLLSVPNRANLEPVKAYLEANHWMVPILLYGLMPDTYSTIAGFLISMKNPSVGAGGVSR